MFRAPFVITAKMCKLDGDVIWTEILSHPHCSSQAAVQKKKKKMTRHQTQDQSLNHFRHLWTKKQRTFLGSDRDTLLTRVKVPGPKTACLVSGLLFLSFQPLSVILKCRNTSREIRMETARDCQRQRVKEMENYCLRMLLCKVGRPGRWGVVVGV